MKKEFTRKEYNNYMKAVDNYIETTETIINDLPKVINKLPKFKKIKQLSFEDWVKFRNGELKIS